MTNKPAWVVAFDNAQDALRKAGGPTTPEWADTHIRAAYAWMEVGKSLKGNAPAQSEEAARQRYLADNPSIPFEYQDEFWDWSAERRIGFFVGKGLSVERAKLLGGLGSAQ